MVNNEGNAEIMGVVLLIAIFVAAVGLMGITMLSAPQPEKVPAVALDFWADDSHTNISLIHRGGETLNLSGAKLMVLYSGDSTAQDKTSAFNLTNSSGLSTRLSSTTPELYSIGDNLSFTADRKIDQVQLIWPGTGLASMTGGGGAVLLGAWSPDSSSGRNPPAAVTGAVPITFPYPSEGPTWTQPTQNPTAPWVYFIANITATNGTVPINFTDLTDYHGWSSSYKRSWNFGDSGSNVITDQTNPYTYPYYQAPTDWPYIKNYTVTLNLTDESDVLTPYSLARQNYISVYKSPIAGFDASPLEGNSGMEVWFTNTTTGYETSLSWDFGDENRTTNAYPRPAFPYTYYNPGSIQQNYTASLIANVDLGDNPHESSDPFQRVIIVHPQVIAAFTATPMTGPAPLTVSFDSNSSQGYLLSYFWDFGDGTTFTSQNPQHTYTTAGNYTVNLTVSNTLPGPNTSTTSRTITVTAPPLAPPVANFTATPMNGTAPLLVTFTDTSTNTPTTWNWSFGDGNTATLQNPTHTYTTPGAYTVTLTVSNAVGNSTATKTVMVYNNQNTIRVDAGYGANSTDCLGNVWLADREYTSGMWGYSPTGAPLYSVNGSIANTSDPALYRTSRWSTTGTVDYQFNVPNGNYNVQLKFAETDTSINAGNPRKFDVTVNNNPVASSFDVYGTVGANSTADLYSNVTVIDNLIHVVLKGTTGQPMIAAIGIAPASTWVSPAFTANQTIGNTQLPVQFNDTSTGTVNRWFWDFGDGATSTIQNPTHTYTLPGTYKVMLTAGNANQSGTVVKKDYITVGPALAANFTANPTTGIAPLAVGFTDTSTGNGISNWSWTFGDGATSTIQNPTHTYTLPGTYNVTLTVTNPYASASTTKTITVHSLNPNFTANRTIGNAPLPVLFTDTTTSDLAVNAWTWNFGDNSTATTQSPTHSYTTPGIYTVTLTVSNTSLGFTNTTTKSAYITVLQPLVPNFTANRTAGNGQVPVQFTDTTTGTSITTWTWNLGDGNTSTLQNPTHTYTTPGTYTVTLTAGNAYGNGTVTRTGYITVYPPLVAAFGGAPLLGNAPLNVSFVDQSTGFTISGWNWTFGDGTTSTSQSPQHTYTAGGNYTVTLTITNAYGTASISKPAFVTVLPQLVANFTANRTAGNAQFPVQFTDTSTGSGINGWSWNFGDNTTTSAQNPTHTYTTAGNYTVSLTAFNPYGNTTTIRTNYITVLNPPVAAFTGTPTVGNGQANVTFTDQSTGDGIITWAWTFGDGNTATTRSPQHLYTNQGTIPKTFNVTLTVTNAYGSGTTTKTGYITVYPPLVANFTTTATTGYAPLQVDFTDTSTGYNIIAWTWNFGDGSQTGISQNVSHSYNTPGTYTATLVVTNPFGQSTQATRTITVNAPATTPTPAGGLINGTIYNDQNGDGVANTADPKLAGWTINLFLNGNVIATTTSDANGAYAFYGLDNAKGYTVVEVLPMGWRGTNPAGGTTGSVQINPGSKSAYTNTNFWNYYKPVSPGGPITLNAAKPGSLVSGGYFQFRDTVAWSGSTGVSIDGTFHQINQDDIVRLTIEKSGSANIQISSGGIWTFTAPDATLSINGVVIQRGAVTGIAIHGFDTLQSTLAVTVPSQNVWTSFTVNGGQVIPGQNDNRIINLYNVTTGTDGGLNLQVGADIYIIGSTGTYQLLP
ncbi:PKD domain-containing protein [Methanosphaerula palustris]|uniref:PKD domain containing protein n=1 Tax=Methanosphaerula palustris (strain ATCC BAA-1556 / DSM 19958 / E1-9c) TaxID=521011 RepID=B8GIE2_METPE|nr:PKD domain-containing protein [Methanosphaerula palustris]ACL15493.1 PKD domain containing protein [Methanosphaerula palustris E1-9c]